MSKVNFDLLCEKLEEIVGVGEFKSERYLDEVLSPLDDGGFKNIFIAHSLSTGGMICGEIKLALTLRILGGGSYMDIALIFQISFNHVHKIFKYVVGDWLVHDSFNPINGMEYVCDNNRMTDVALQFSNASNGVINGCIGALDGWVVKIKKPSRRDGVINSQSFYSRKGYFAVNVQAIVDRRKRILFRSIRSRGAEHDSTAFRNSTLYQWLKNNWRLLASKGFYFIGDSAYSLKAFLLTPYDNAVHGTAEDNFNFFHSSARISVECCFGEVDLRWGIFWSELSYSLKTNCQIIDACMRLHNFIVEKRGDTLFSESLDFEVFDDDARWFFAIHPFLDHEGVYGGEDDVRRGEDGGIFRGGRPDQNETSSSNYGRSLRDSHRDEIGRQGLIRPPSNWYRSNNRTLE